MSDTLTAECTGIAARWCPIHGDCTCREAPCEPDCDLCSGEACATHGYDPCECDTAARHAEDEKPLTRWDCPLHGTRSNHPDAQWTASPLDSDWPGYHTHWTPLPVPDFSVLAVTPDAAPAGEVG